MDKQIVLKMSIYAQFYAGVIFRIDFSFGDLITRAKGLSINAENH